MGNETSTAQNATALNLSSAVSSVNENSVRKKLHECYGSITHLMSMSYLIHKKYKAKILLFGEMHMRHSRSNNRDNYTAGVGRDPSGVSHIYLDVINDRIARSFGDKLIYLFLEKSTGETTMSERIPLLVDRNTAAFALDIIRKGYNLMPNDINTFIENITEKNLHDSAKIRDGIEFLLMMPFHYWLSLKSIISNMEGLLHQYPLTTNGNQTNISPDAVSDWITRTKQAILNLVSFPEGIDAYEIPGSKKISMKNRILFGCQSGLYHVIIQYITLFKNGRYEVNHENLKYLERAIISMGEKFELDPVKIKQKASMITEGFDKYVRPRHGTKSYAFFRKSLIADRVSDLHTIYLVWLFDILACPGVSYVIQNQLPYLRTRVYHQSLFNDAPNNEIKDTGYKNILYMCGNYHVPHTIDLLLSDGWELVIKKNRANNTVNYYRLEMPSDFTEDYFKRYTEHILTMEPIFMDENHVDAQSIYESIDIPTYGYKMLYPEDIDEVLKLYFQDDVESKSGGDENNMGSAAATILSAGMLMTVNTTVLACLIFALILLTYLIYTSLNDNDNNIKKIKTHPKLLDRIHHPRLLRHVTHP